MHNWVYIDEIMNFDKKNCKKGTSFYVILVKIVYISNQNRNIDDDLNTSFNTQLNINRVAPNNESIAPNRNRSVSPLDDIESNRSSTANSTLHFTRPPDQSNVRLARFTSINNTTRNSANNFPTNFSFDETNLARFFHSLELLDRKIENLSNRREPAVKAAPTVGRMDMIVYSARFRQLLANEFGYDEIYNHQLEYFLINFPFRCKLFEEALAKECPQCISFNDAFERLKTSWKQ